jgi:anaerobic ribonucleoside-triphosphate reductase
MKTILALLILFSAIALPALGELTDADLNKIRLIVNDSEKRVKEDIKAEIASSEKNIKEYINLKIDSVEKRLSTYNWVIYVLMPLIVAAIGIPTAIMAWRSGKDRSLERQVETLTREIETLKQQRIVSS